MHDTQIYVAISLREFFFELVVVVVYIFAFIYRGFLGCAYAPSTLDIWWHNTRTGSSSENQESIIKKKKSFPPFVSQGHMLFASIILVSC